MTNNQKKEILTIWTNLKEKILSLLSDLDSAKSNQEAVIERYEKKIRDKNEEIAKIEEEYKDLSDIVSKVRKKVSVRPNNNIRRQEILDILNRR